MTLAILSARHFFPSSAFPPYPLPYDQILRSSGKWTMYFSLSLLGQVLSSTPRAMGEPTEWTQGMKAPSSPSIRSACSPMRVMMRMFTTA